MSAAEPLLLAVFVEDSHHATPVDALVEEVQGYVPSGTYKEDIRMNGQRVLAFEFPEQPELKALERVDHLTWVRTSEGTAWTGPLPPAPERDPDISRCPFHAMAEALSEEELQAFLAEHRARQQQQN